MPVAWGAAGAAVAGVCAGWCVAWRYSAAHYSAALTAELTGRRKAEQRLLHHLASAAAPPSDSAPDAATRLPVAPIGTIRSPFADRNGTPRQPGVVPSSISTLRLHPAAASPTMLKGLGGYSHIFVLFWFHLNTNSAKDSSRVKGVVRPPRARGEAVGVFACRTPHRPNPIGLSLCEVVAVDATAGTVTVSGLDVVDGTPLLDIKPYLPQADQQAGARCPQWVVDSYREEGEAGAFSRYAVVFTPKAEEDVAHFSGVQLACTSLRSLVEDTLRTDFRSTRQQELEVFDGTLRLQKVTVMYTIDVPSSQVTVTAVIARGEGGGDVGSPE